MGKVVHAPRPHRLAYGRGVGEAAQLLHVAEVARLAGNLVESALRGVGKPSRLPGRKAPLNPAAHLALEPACGGAV